MQVKNPKYQLVLNFQEIFEKDNKLALLLCKEQGTNSGWLDEVGAAYFKQNGVDTSCVAISFDNMPNCMMKLTEFLKQTALSVMVSLCSGSRIANTAMAHGRYSMDIIICGILGILEAGVSWGGEITEEDLFLAGKDITDLKLVIGKVPVVRNGASVDCRLDDLWRIWSLVQPKYLIEGELPIYFSRLQLDLFYANTLDLWFVEYLGHHPALYSPNPRKNLSLGFNLATKQSSNSPAPLFGSFWDNKPCAEDWAYCWDDQDEMLNSLYLFDPKKWKSKEEATLPPKNPDGHGFVKNPYYSEDFRSLLQFRRNGLQHPESHFKYSDLDEVELHLSYQFEHLLPDIIRHLLSSDKMEGHFSVEWTTYKASKSDQREPPGT